MPQYKFTLIAKVDNDIETITPNWLDRCAAVAAEYNILCSPLVIGLKSFPNGVPGYAFQDLKVPEVGKERIRLTPHIGGIVHMAKANLHLGYKYDENLKMGVDQDVSFTTYAHQRHYLIGYLEDVQIAHRTREQEKKYPEYYKEKAEIWHERAWKDDTSD